MIGIPIRDNNPRSSKPFFTYLILAANIAVYFYQASLHPAAERLFILTYGAIPVEILHFQGLHTLLTSMFIHGGLFHLLGNMLYLYIFSDNVEDLLGHTRFVIFYVISGVGAAAAHILVDPGSTVPMVGASGAISGVLGAYMVSYPRARVLVAVPIFFYIYRTFWIPAIIVLGLWFVFQLMFGLFSIGMPGGGVAWFAHIGGFVIGMILVKVMAPKGRLYRPHFVDEEIDEEYW